MVEKLYVIAVAPHTGAWIETGKVMMNVFTADCRSPYGSVD